MNLMPATILRHLAGLGLLVVFMLAGEVLARWTHVPLPGSVLGMVLLTAALHLRLLRAHWVAPAADLLIRNMGFLFVPPGVGLMLHFELIRREWLPIGVGALLSIVAVLVGVGLLQQRLERR
jgi:holin-like protein